MTVLAHGKRGKIAAFLDDCGEVIDIDSKKSDQAPDIKLRLKQYQITFDGEESDRTHGRNYYRNQLVRLKT